MTCPHCNCDQAKELKKPTNLGYKGYYCGGCDRTFNDITDTPFDHLKFPTDIVLLVALW